MMLINLLMPMLKFDMSLCTRQSSSARVASEGQSGVLRGPEGPTASQQKMGCDSRVSNEICLAASRPRLSARGRHSAASLEA